MSNRSLSFCALASLLLLPAAAIAAPIGNAIAVTPAANTEGARGVVTLTRGAGVEAYDRVSTSAGGSTKLRFLDRSTLDVGPGSLVTLDRFVYNPDATASTAALTMAKGSFRWVSGRSPKDAYDLKTPLATIGIRGTDFRVFADPEVTTIRLQSGALTACSRVSRQCADVARGGQGVRLWSDGRVETFGPGTQQQPPTRRADLPPGRPPPGSGAPPLGPGEILPGLSIGIGIGTGGGRPGRNPPREPRYPQQDGRPAGNYPTIMTPR